MDTIQVVNNIWMKLPEDLTTDIKKYEENPSKYDGSKKTLIENFINLKNKKGYINQPRPKLLYVSEKEAYNASAFGTTDETNCYFELLNGKNHFVKPYFDLDNKSFLDEKQLLKYKHSDKHQRNVESIVEKVQEFFETFFSKTINRDDIQIFERSGLAKRKGRFEYNISMRVIVKNYKIRWSLFTYLMTTLKRYVMTDIQTFRKMFKWSNLLTDFIQNEIDMQVYSYKYQFINMIGFNKHVADVRGTFLRNGDKTVAREEFRDTVIQLTTQTDTLIVPQKTSFIMFPEQEKTIKDDKKFQIVFTTLPQYEERLISDLNNHKTQFTKTSTTCENQISDTKTNIIELNDIPNEKLLWENRIKVTGFDKSGGNGYSINKRENFSYATQLKTKYTTQWKNATFKKHI